MSNAMIHFHRRALLVCAASAISFSKEISVLAFAASYAVTLEAWLDLALSAKKIDSPLHMGRFKDPMYCLLDPISWSPIGSSADRFRSVTVPTGFVTDLASIPPVFYTWLRPDGDYAFAAIVHDYLYWEQALPRKEADDILKLAMEDLKVDSSEIEAIFLAVRTFGQHAWEQNKELKANGEKRILAKFPPTADITWEEWKGRPDVFFP
jgi:hypothetical protein